MRKTIGGKRILLAAVGSVVLAALPSVGWSQYQTDNNTGRALDANNRLGSDGVNDARQNTGGITSDDIVYGNVTRGKQFRGTATQDPRAFRGNTSDRQSDNLVRDAGPSVYQRGGDYDPYASQRYWGDSRGVNPPAGFAQLTPGSSGSFQTSRQQVRIPGDMRVDNNIYSPDLNIGYGIDLSAMASANPMGMPTSDVAEMNRLAQNNPELRAAGNRMPSQQLLERLHLDQGAIERMREELRNSARSEESQNGQPANPNDLTNPPESPQNPAFSSELRSDVESRAMEASANTDQTIRQRLLTATPAALRQSSQYAELQNRLERFRQRQAMTDEEANRDFMKQWNADQESRKKTAAQLQQDIQNQQNTPPLKPGEKPAKTNEHDRQDRTAPTGPDRAHVLGKMQQNPTRRVEGTPPSIPDVPLKVTSFADGVKAMGLKTLLTNAESAMRGGKYTQSLDYYDAAASVAPNNPLITMGRSICEMGAGYYTRAQMHLEQVLSADPSLLMARYDLKTFYGEDRLQYLVRDLKDVANTEKTQFRPLFLLAFIAYSTENPQRASDYLAMAEQRGGNRQFYANLREYWKLPKPSEQDTNK